MTMLTLFGKDISELTYNELKRERRTQKYLLRVLGNALKVEVHKNGLRKIKMAEEGVERSTQISDDKIAFLGIYVQHLEAVIGQIDYYMMHRSEPLSNATYHKSQKKIRTLNAKKRKANIAENKRIYDWKRVGEKDGFLVSWDRKKFMAITADRGYQTEEAVIYAIGQELKLDRARAKYILSKGRFTWAQVLCLGSMLEMTPKEFCDTFLAGYFIDQNGEYRANM